MIVRPADRMCVFTANLRCARACTAVLCALRRSGCECGPLCTARSRRRVKGASLKPARCVVVGYGRRRLLYSRKLPNSGQSSVRGPVWLPHTFDHPECQHQSTAALGLLALSSRSTRRLVLRTVMAFFMGVLPARQLSDLCRRPRRRGARQVRSAAHPSR